MSTHAYLVVRDPETEEYTHVYVHFDGYPEHMLESLPSWSPQDILESRDIRFLDSKEIEPFEDAREPVRSDVIMFGMVSYVYLWDEEKSEWTMPMPGHLGDSLR